MWTIVFSFLYDLYFTIWKRGEEDYIFELKRGSISKWNNDQNMVKKETESFHDMFFY